MLHEWGHGRREYERECRAGRYRRHRYYDDQLLSEWLISEFIALVRSLRRLFSRQGIRARRQMLSLPARLITTAMVEGQIVRLRGRIAFAPLASAEGAPDELERMVEAGGALPDFSLILADDVAASVAVRDADERGQLRVLDLWEDRETHARCDERTTRLFRQTRLRAGQLAEVCGVATRTIDLEQAGAGYRGSGLRWRLVAAEVPLTILFPDRPGRPVLPALPPLKRPRRAP
jgi:hypothetical protein